MPDISAVQLIGFAIEAASPRVPKAAGTDLGQSWTCHASKINPVSFYLIIRFATPGIHETGIQSDETCATNSDSSSHLGEWLACDQTRSTAEGTGNRIAPAPYFYNRSSLPPSTHLLGSRWGSRSQYHSRGRRRASRTPVSWWCPARGFRGQSEKHRRRSSSRYHSRTPAYKRRRSAEGNKRDKIR